MKNKRTRFGTTSKVAVAAAVMAMPALAHAQKPKSDAPSSARSADAHLKSTFPAQFVKMKCPCVIAGSDGKHEVYKNSAGQYFWLDPKTGDQKFVSANAMQKIGGRSE
jgi:hypothetical protein